MAGKNAGLLISLLAMYGAPSLRPRFFLNRLASCCNTTVLRVSLNPKYTSGVKIPIATVVQYQQRHNGPNPDDTH